MSTVSILVAAGDVQRASKELHWSSVLLEHLTTAGLVTLPAQYGTRRFIFVFVRVRQ